MKVISVTAGTRLDQLLKYADIVSTGGEAKHVIQEGMVTVNNRIETRRGYKIKEGDVVKVGTVSLKISLKE
jgi:ribosome-associated protein